MASLLSENDSFWSKIVSDQILTDHTFSKRLLKVVAPIFARWLTYEKHMLLELWGELTRADGSNDNYDHEYLQKAKAISTVLDIMVDEFDLTDVSKLTTILNKRPDTKSCAPEDQQE